MIFAEKTVQASHLVWKVGIFEGPAYVTPVFLQSVPHGYHILRCATHNFWNAPSDLFRKINNCYCTIAQLI